MWARGGHGTAPGCFDEPSGVAFARGVIAVAERARVQLLTREGAPLRLVPLPTELAKEAREAAAANLRGQLGHQ